MSNRTKSLIVRSICIISAPLLAGLMVLLGAMGAERIHRISAQSPTQIIVAEVLADTYVSSGVPDQRKPSISAIWVGYDVDELRERRTLLKFGLDRSAIPVGSTIISAQMVLYVSGTTPNDSALNVSVNRILDDFNEDINWQEHLSLAANSSTSTSALTAILAGAEWDVTGLVEEWLADSQSGDSIGFVLRGDQTSGAHRRGFWSKECIASECADSQKPKLIINYTVPATPNRTYFQYLPLIPTG